MRKFLLIVSLFLSCARDNELVAPTMSERLAALSAKRDLYCELGRPKYDTKLHINDRCNGLLWTSLWSVACNYGSVLQFESQSEPGRLYRDPGHSCLADGGSDSDIAKDDLQGWLLKMAKTPDRDQMQRVLDYCMDNQVLENGIDIACKMGEAKDKTTEVSKTYWPITSIQLLRDMLDRPLRLVQFPEKEGFPAHLEVLGIQARGLTYGGLTDLQVKTLKGHAERVKRNSMFNGYYFQVSQDQEALERAVSFLEDKAHWPDEKLPTNQNHCSSYLFQREDEPKDWEPCDISAQHDGVDFVYAVAAILGELNK